jgi:hypothetical protein
VSTLHLWLAREAQRQARHPDLTSALVSGRGAAYARQRLLPVVLRQLLRTGLHGLEIYLLARALPYEVLAPLLGYRGAVALASTTQWGALEGLRQRVRACVRARELSAARSVVESWLFWSSLLVALPVLGFCVVIGSAYLRAGPGISLFDCYGLACFVRLACDVYARTYHAGVFAVRRVYRAPVSWLAADVLELTLIVLCFDRLGPWCLPLAIVAAGALDAGLSLSYARRAYGAQRLLLPRLWRRHPLPRQVPRALLRDLLVHSLANASMQLDAVLLLLLLRVDPPRAKYLAFSVVYYVLRPVLGFAAHWVRSFYFDLSRMEAGAFTAWRPRLSRYLLRLSLGCALALSLVSLLAAALLWPEQADWTLLYFAPFILVRSLFAQLQLEAFVRGHYRPLLRVTLAVVLGLGLYSLVAPSGVALLNAATLLLGLGYALLRTRRATLQRNDEAWLGLAEWLHALQASEAVQLCVLAVARSSVPPGRLVALLEQKVLGIRLARYARSHLLLFVPAGSAPSLANWIALAGGTLSDAWLSPTCHGSQGVALARAQQALPPELDAALTPALPTPGAHGLIADFRREFARGTLIDVTAGTGALPSAQLPRALLGDFMQQVALACRQRELTQRNRLPVELAVYAPAGQARLIFVVERSARGFAAFRNKVRAASMHASYYGPSRV